MPISKCLARSQPGQKEGIKVGGAMVEGGRSRPGFVVFRIVLSLSQTWDQNGIDLRKIAL